MKRLWVAISLALALSCTGELPELVKVGGKPNPFEVYELKFHEPPKVLTKNMSIRGKISNSSKEKMSNIRVKGTVALNHGQALEATFDVPELESEYGAEFYITPVGLNDKSNVKTVTFTVISFTRNQRLTGRRRL